MALTPTRTPALTPTLTPALTPTLTPTLTLSGMVGRLFTQLGVPPDVLRRYGASGGGGSGSRAPVGAAGEPGAEVAPGPGVAPPAGRHLRKESWFRGVADPTGALPAGYT